MLVADVITQKSGWGLSHALQSLQTTEAAEVMPGRQPSLETQQVCKTEVSLPVGRVDALLIHNWITELPIVCE